MGGKSNSTPSFIESDPFITKPTLPINSMSKNLVNDIVYLCIRDQIMKDKNCTFELCKVSI